MYGDTEKFRILLGGFKVRANFNQELLIGANRFQLFQSTSRKINYTLRNQEAKQFILEQRIVLLLNELSEYIFDTVHEVEI